MFRYVKKLIQAILILIVVLAYQNCELASLESSSKSSAGLPRTQFDDSGNGGGYSGFNVSGPQATKAGETAVFVLTGGVAPYHYEILEGDGQFVPDATGVKYMTSTDSAIAIHRLRFSDSSSANVEWRLEVSKVEATDFVLGDKFGAAVKVSENLVIVGSPGDSSRLELAGRAQVYERVGSSWRFKQDLVAPLAWAANFGAAINMSGDQIIVGAPGYSPNYPTIRYSGRAFIFSATPEGYKRSGELYPSEPLSDARFGVSVFVQDDLAIVGSRPDEGGAVYIFQKSNGVWKEVQKLAPTQDVTAFGWRLAYDSGLLAVGTRGEWHPGWVFVYKRLADGKFEPAAELKQLASSNYSGFGSALSFVNGRLLIAEAKSQTASYLHEYVLDGGKMILNSSSIMEHQASPEESSRQLRANDRFVVFSCRYEWVNGLEWAGAVYLYERVDGQLVFRKRITAETPRGYDMFGIGADIVGTRLILSGTLSGSAMVIDLAAPAP